MKRTVEILLEGFLLISRNFGLVYGLLGFLLVISLLLPKTMVSVESLVSEPAWILLFICLLLLCCAFLAGWFTVMREAVLQWERLMTRLKGGKNETDESFPMPFTGLKPWLQNFSAGVGEFFIPVVLGYAIQVGILFLILWLTLMLLDNAYGGYPKILETLLNQPTPAALQQKLLLLSTAEKRSLVEWFGGFSIGLLVYGLFYLLTALWPMYLVLESGSIWQAYQRSVRQVLRDPLRILAISLFIFVGGNLLSLFLQVGNSFVLYLVQFLSLIFQIYGWLVLFLYTARYGNIAPTETQSE